ncbi:hypothetical protein C2W62_16880 [Candidatus Entotheonella serta]|nr:hypothetical protein C2W62_16880 [Candidatus Entotheonella serta]
MVGNRQCRSFIVSSDILCHAGGNARNARLLPRRSGGNASKCLNRVRNVLDPYGTACTGAVAMHRHGTIIGRSQATRLVNGRVGIGVVTGRERTNEHFGTLIDNRFGKCFHPGLSARQHGEGMIEHAVLEYCIARFSKGASEGKITEKPPRRRGSHNLFADRTQCHRG